MKFPILFPFIVLFLVIYAIRRHRQESNQKKVFDDFWERERAANMTRKKDISNLDYLSLSLEKLPLGKYTDAVLNEQERILQDLSKRKCINLSEYSNTDLKLMYGAANINLLTEYDSNYHTLSQTLLAYANREIELNHSLEAICILEYAMELRLDSSAIYVQLAALYQENNMADKLPAITAAVSSMNASFSRRVLPKLPACRTDG